MDTSFTVVPLIFVLMLFLCLTVFNATTLQQTLIYEFFNFKISASSMLENSQSQNDTIIPSINITYPSYPPSIMTGKIVIEGYAIDSGSGIHNISATYHTFPFKGKSERLTVQTIQNANNKINWSIPLTVDKPGSYRVLVTAIDNGGNKNSAETTINAALPEKISTLATNEMAPKIAFVRPTFTEAAYQEHGFYRFYFKYGYPPQSSKNITTDLDMLTVKTPKSVAEFQGNDIRNLSNITSLVPINGTELHDVSLGYFPAPQKFWIPFIDSIKKVAPNSTVTVMRDEDVNDGHIFYPNDKKINAYDILLLFHNEYVTQKEYNNLREFVGNGGTIVFIDANALFAEIRYDRNNHTITLVKGHDWEFTGKNAKKGVTERWFNETKEWVGGNYLLDYIGNKVGFENNPFNYTHFEEQYVNNPNAKILIDYGIKYTRGGYFKDPSLFTKQVASYILDYGKGKVIMLGLTAKNLADNQKFITFFRNAILPNALCPKFLSCVLENPENDYTPPSVNITSPAFPPTISTGKVLMEGFVKDSNSGIANISASIGSFPFVSKSNVKLVLEADSSSHNNWSRWTLPLVINDTGAYRVMIKVVDKAGNTNYAETTINAALSEKSDRLRSNNVSTTIAFVRPTFTEAAYQQFGFFDFYLKHAFPSYGKNITSDLEMLTVKTPKSVAEFADNDIKHLSNITSLVPINGTELHDASTNFFPNQQSFWLPFIDSIKKVAPNSTVTVMRDEDVNDGHIFYSNDKKINAYDILLLFNNEYVTQKEYDNLREFVRNGGTIVIIDANVFRAEVSFDKDNHTVTLVKGHDWKFDGKSASRSLPERWYNQTKIWVGSNFLDIYANVTFSNNPFNYTHYQERFVNNPNATIINDYGIQFPEEFVKMYAIKEKLPAELQREDIPIENIKVATYSLDYGKGKVIMSGITGRSLSGNEEFMKYFDNVILPKALLPKS